MSLRIGFVGHEATRTGAPLMLLHLLRWIRAHAKCEIELLLLKGGELEPEYERICPVTLATASLWPSWLRRGMFRRAAIRRRAGRWLRRGDWDLVYVNTVATRAIFQALKSVRCPVVCHDHEMKFVLEQMGALPLLARADRILVPSEATRRDLIEYDPSAADKVEVFHECIPTTGPSEERAERTLALRRELGIGPDDRVVGAVGAVGWRKGSDLFLQVADRLQRGAPALPVRFLWVGSEPSASTPWARQLRHDLERLGLADRLRFTGPVADVSPYYRLMDVLAVTSREDPSPLVAIEAALHRVPIACFARSGGAPELFGGGAATVAPYLDTSVMAEQILSLLRNPEARAAMGRRGEEIARRQHDVNEVAPRIWSLLEDLLARARARR